jgi:beta-lactamase regulating signal transducer with metallopeptidase domain
MLGLTMLSVGAVRLARTVRATSHAVSQWIHTAEPVALPVVTIPAFAVDASFPIVAVVGIARPRLVVARSVLKACSPDELAAVLMHEQHHVDRRDNLRRAVMIALPDFLAWFPASRRLLADWRDAGEDAADEAAERLGAQGRLLLAQALIRVARLAPPGAWAAPLPASALYRGGSLDRRIRRLLAPQLTAAGRQRPWLAAVALSVTVGAFAALDTMHSVIEFAVTRLP